MGSDVSSGNETYYSLISSSKLIISFLGAVLSLAPPNRKNAIKNMKILFIIKIVHWSDNEPNLHLS